MTYAIIYQRHNNSKILERFSDEQWESLPPAIKDNPEKTVYVTHEIDDPKIKDFKEIIWVRIDSKDRSQNKAKITVPFTPENIPLMEENAKTEIQRKIKYWNNVEKMIQQKQDKTYEAGISEEGDIFAVIIMTHNNKKYLERFPKSKWENLSIEKRNDTSKIPFYSDNIRAEEFNDFDEIIWDRIYNAKLKVTYKITVPFTPENIPLMEENAIRKINEKNDYYQKIISESKENKLRKNKISYEEHKNHVSEIDKNFSEDMSDYDAILKWKELNYTVAPPPSRILRLKQEYDKSWEEFIFLCQNIK